MAIEFLCERCGKPLRADDRFEGKQTRCPSCKNVNVVPHQLEVVDNVTTSVSLPPPLPPPTAEAQIAVNLFECPECGTLFAENAVLCIDCGYDRRTGRRQKTKKRRLHRKLDYSLPFWARLSLSSLALLFALSAILDPLHPYLELLPVFLLCGVAAATRYSYSCRVIVRRNSQGDVILKWENWYCFVPVSWTKNLHGYKVAWTDYYIAYSFNFEGGRMGLKPHYSLEIAGPEKAKEVLYAGPNEEYMKDLADVLQFDAGVTVRRK